MVTNKAQGSVLLLEGHLTWGLDCRSLLNFVCGGKLGILTPEILLALKPWILTTTQ